MLRQGFLHLTRSRGVRSVVTRSPFTSAIRRRFVAGDTLDDFLRVARETRAEGLAVSGNYLGEAVRDPAQARRAAAGYCQLLERLEEVGPGVNVSVKLSQLGFDLGRDSFVENLERVLTCARAAGAFLRIDMESSAYTARTLETFEELRGRGMDRVGIVLQAYLRRTAGDVRRMIELGAPVRLCKGAYAEPEELAFQDPGEVRAAFLEAARWLLRDGRNAAIATHDEELIRDVIDFATRSGTDPSTFEFQLLFGVRRDLQRALVRRGYRVRVYIPFGENWYPYLMRRLAERPENLLFMVGSVVRESPVGSLLPGRRGIGSWGP